jgi:FtsP/CotA-like multicopper oxidase with cupredoxin domain
MKTSSADNLNLSRRTFLKQGLAVAGTSSIATLVGCTSSENSAVTYRRSASGSNRLEFPVQSTGGPVREFRRIAEIGQVEVGRGVTYQTWLYNGRFPGEEIRVREGERLRVTVENRLPEGTTIHWHGVPVPNAMDGVPGISQAPTPPGENFVYEFVAGPPGTYLYHSHYGLQSDRGLVGSLVIEENTPHVEWDREHTLVFDDFLPSAPQMPDTRRGPMGGMGRGMRGMGMMAMMGMDTPPYTGVLVNGRLPSDAPVFDVRQGDHVRLRLINASGATTFRIAVAGHQMTVSHADGRPVEPLTVASIIIAAGERYDVIVDSNNPGAWALVAAPLEINVPAARAVIRYAGVAASAPPDGQVPDGLRSGRELRPGDLISLELGGASEAFDRTMDFVLSGGMMSPGWTMNGQAYPDADALWVRQGERIRVRLTNHSMMLHPMHLHGHFFRIGRALKDTAIVPPHMGNLTFDFVANNPGQWFFHCHNVYHMESGMARLIRYAS